MNESYINQRIVLCKCSWQQNTLRLPSVHVCLYLPVYAFSLSSDATSGTYQQVVLESNSDHMIKLANGTLRIIMAREDDHGYYLCHASNGIGIGISKVVFLRVHSKYTFHVITFVLFLFLFSCLCLFLQISHVTFKVWIIYIFMFS